MESPFTKRIIIGGVPRSGTTLFRYILDASPRIIAGPETGFFLRPLALQQGRVERVAARVNRALEIGVERIADIIMRGRKSIACFDEMMLAYRQRADAVKDVWAEKTPWNCGSYQWLAWEDPEAFFISLIRDGRDVVTSIRDQKYYISVQAYVETMRFVLGFEHGRHLVVRYEDMVSQPEACFRRVFDFLELPFTGQMLEEYRRVTVTRDPSKVRQPKAQEAISTGWIARWTRAEHAARVEEFQSHLEAMQMLVRSGYVRQPC